MTVPKCEFCAKRTVPEATELVAIPASFPSKLITPPDWLKVEPLALIIFPFTFNVPPETVKVPLLTNILLLFVQPTVTAPEATTNAPALAIESVFELLAAEFTVTV